MAGRHPVVESYQIERGNSFVSNDCHLSSDEQIQLVTGPVSFI